MPIRTLSPCWAFVIAALMSTAQPAQAGLVRAIEYAGDHMFLTANPDEIAALDGGATPGWKRTGIELWVSDAMEPGLAPVCRFYSAAFAPRSSHFYTADPAECAAVRANADWIDEGIAFYARLPVPNGSENNSACPIGSAPVYRWYNNGQGGAPNHRFTPYYHGVVEIMSANEWSLEGYGGGAVAFCMHDAEPFRYDPLKPLSAHAELLADSVWQVERAASTSGFAYRFEIGFGSAASANGSVPITGGAGRPTGFQFAQWDIGGGNVAIDHLGSQTAGWRFVLTGRDSVVGCALTLAWIYTDPLGPIGDGDYAYWGAPCVPFSGHRR